MEELQERQRDLLVRSEMNQNNDYMRTAIIIGSWIMIQMVVNFVKIRQYMGSVGENMMNALSSGNRNSRQEFQQPRSAWTGQQMRVRNAIPLM